MNVRVFISVTKARGGAFVPTGPFALFGGGSSRSLRAWIQEAASTGGGGVDRDVSLLGSRISKRHDNYTVEIKVV